MRFVVCYPHPLFVLVSKVKLLHEGYLPRIDPSHLCLYLDRLHDLLTGRHSPALEHGQYNTAVTVIAEICAWTVFAIVFDALEDLVQAPAAPRRTRSYGAKLIGEALRKVLATVSNLDSVLASGQGLHDLRGRVQLMTIRERFETIFSAIATLKEDENIKFSLVPQDLLELGDIELKELVFMPAIH